MKFHSLVMVAILLFTVTISTAHQRLESDPNLPNVWRLQTEMNSARNLGYLVVSPNGPGDGGDFGPFTPGTKTSGLQEAFDYAKKMGRDLYIVGGNVTQGKTPGVVYVLNETLNIPWMQDFKCDAGYALILYKPLHGDAIVMDSQMTCSYHFGLIVSNSDGAVLSIKPHTTGPDKFIVFTTTDITINALVGGGGAWPSGEAFNSTLDPKRKWIGAGLLLDATLGPIDSNRFKLIEIVGCDKGVYLTGACTDNWIEVTDIHLCKTQLQLGEPGAKTISHNRISAHMNSEGIADAAGARIYGQNNQLNLTAGSASPGNDLILESEAAGNLIFANHLFNGVTNRAAKPTNRLIMTFPEGYQITTPAFPATGQEVTNKEPFTVEVSILTPGKVTAWKIRDINGAQRSFKSGLFAGQPLLLQPGDIVAFDYTEAPTWSWRVSR